jgi:hypothetical protein
MRVTAALACALATLALAGAAGAATFGITDDAGKYAGDGGASFFSTLNDLGMNENRVTVQWDPARPTTIVDQPFLDRSVPQANRHGIDLVFSIYPAKARALVDTPNGVNLFAQFAAQVARRYPSVHKIICLNEGNQTRFQQPQYDDTGKGVAGAIQEAAMAACYDALKAVNPSIQVIGFGFSPRGNDDPDAPSNVSHSPLSFLAEIGAAYRASGRTRPIADGVSLHCYPRSNTDGPGVGFAWPNVGCANLDRFKQGWWDAFHGTGQPVFQEAGGGSPGPFVRLFIDESGWQARVASDKAGLYSGNETVPAIDDTMQGSYYAQLISLVACDPDIALYNIFHLVDERALAGWQSGLQFVDGSRRASYATVKAAVSANSTCHGTMHAWRHVTSVAGAKVDFGALRKRSFTVSADEGFTWKVTLLRGKKVVGARAGDGGSDTTIRFKLPKLKRGQYRVRIELHAEWNGERASVFTRAFQTR